MDIIEKIGLPAMMGQLAEECTELAQATLKYQRILMGCNPTPVTEDQALRNLTEEAQDVQDCLLLLEEYGIKIDDLPQSARKMERWASRIAEREDDIAAEPRVLERIELCGYFSDRALKQRRDEMAKDIAERMLRDGYIKETCRKVSGIYMDETNLLQMKAVVLRPADYKQGEDGNFV